MKALGRTTINDNISMLMHEHPRMSVGEAGHLIANHFYWLGALAMTVPGRKFPACANVMKLGGCQLHNVQCGWPKCNDTKESLATAPQPVEEPKSIEAPTIISNPPPVGAELVDVLISAWVDTHRQPMPWYKAVRVAAIISNLSGDQEEELRQLSGTARTSTETLR